MAYSVSQTEIFGQWFRSLRDREAKQRISARLKRLVVGNFGDMRSVGGGVSELRIDHGPGYRVYFSIRQSQIVILLMGGDKDSQQRDIRLAQQLAKSWDA